MTQGREQIPRAEAFRDLGGAVGAAGIGNDDFVGPQQPWGRAADRT